MIVVHLELKPRVIFCGIYFFIFLKDHKNMPKLATIEYYPLYSISIQILPACLQMVKGAAMISLATFCFLEGHSDLFIKILDLGKKKLFWPTPREKMDILASSPESKIL